MRIVKVLAKILLAVLSILSFLCAFFFIGAYYMGALSHLYRSQSSVYSIYAFFVVALLVFALLVCLVTLLFLKKVRRYIKAICAVLLALLIPVSLYSSYFAMGWVAFLGVSGCSYTDAVTNYGKYDREFDTVYFPERITEDMTVVDFVYYYKYLDAVQVDIYLEVKFADAQTMERYIAAAVASIGEYELCEHRNPYNEKYTDILTWGNWRDGTAEPNYNFAGFGEHSDGTPYVHTQYYAVSYSYEELTAIYSYTSIGDDILVGNDPDKGEYYPMILKRFGVEWNRANGFRSYDILHSKEI